MWELIWKEFFGPHGLNLNTVIAMAILIMLFLGPDRVAGIFRKAVKQQPDITLVERPDGARGAEARQTELLQAISAPTKRCDEHKGLVEKVAHIEGQQEKQWGEIGTLIRQGERSEAVIKEVGKKVDALCGKVDGIATVQGENSGKLETIINLSKNNK
jgi:hypothetical protein